MYSTCLFCNSALGANESIEHFPVGKRLAYDEATGRLWVVCKKCSRWNLSPLESRWDAIEEAERLFRATKTRVATDNIGLAKLSDGTELVRIGKPPQLELAVWRYGDQFRKRYRKHVTVTTAGAVAFSTSMALLLGPTHTGDLVLNAVVSMGAFTSAGVVKSLSQQRFNKWYRHAIPQVALRDDDNALLRLTQDNIDAAQLSISGSDEWQLSVPHVTTQRAQRLARLLRRNDETAIVHEPRLLHGHAALQGLATLLPRANRDGANDEGVAAALKTIDTTSTLSALLRLASDERAVQPTKRAPRVPGKNISNAPEHVRLALEMSLHAEEERRAMEGELQELEQRWRDADEVARISDGLLLPEAMEGRLSSMRNGHKV